MGYCMGTLSCKHNGLPIVPQAQVKFALSYKKHVAIDLGVLLNVLYLNLEYRF